MSHLIALALAAGAAAIGPGSAPEQLAADLGHPVFARREWAGRRLGLLGETARPALEAAAKGGDPEVVRRAAAILDQFDWGLYPDTPPAVRAAVRRFRTELPAEQGAAVAELARLDAAPTLRRLLGRRHPPAVRAELFAHLTAALRWAVPPLVVAGRHDRAGELLALHALGPDADGLLDLTVFEHLRGRPEPTAPDSARLRVYRLRAAGDPAAAAAAADTPALAADREALLVDAGDWAALADRPVWQANSRAGLKAFRLRLAGRGAEADALLDRLPAEGLGPPGGSAAELDEPTLGLVLNGRADAAADRLARTGYAPHLLADWLTARLRFADALRLIDREGRRSAEFDPKFYAGLYGARRGRLLAMLGRRDEAAAAFRAAFDAVRGDDDRYPLEQLLRAEVRAGRADLACDHLGAAHDAARGRGRAADRLAGAFEAVFDADSEVAAWLLGVLDRRAPAAHRLRRVRALLAGRGTPADLARVAGRPRPDPRADPDRAMTAGQAVAAVLRAAGRAEEAVAVLAAVADRLPPPAYPGRQDDPPGPKAWVYETDERTRFWVEFGDALTDLGRPADAAARLEQGWRQFPDCPTLLFLSGRALADTGRTAVGEARMAAAHWVALGNPRPRGRLLEELTARGEVAAADRERGLAVRAGWRGGRQVANVWNQAAKAASQAGDFPAAAGLHRRALHAVLSLPNVFYTDGSAYLSVPQQVAATQARHLLAEGKVADAVAAAEGCLAVLPADTDLVVSLVTALDTLGRRAEADRLFRREWDTLRGVVAEHPASAWAWAEAAWLAAACRRELDAAAGYAEQAVAAEPDGVLPRKALAEVRFRRGDRAGAVAVTAILAADDRLNRGHRRQLARYRTAPSDAPPPDADD